MLETQAALRRVGRALRAVGEAALDIVFPPACFACEAPLADGRVPMCASCAAALAAQVGDTYCSCCGGDPGPHLLRADGRCTACADRRPACERVVRVGRYASVLRGLVINFKGRRLPALDGFLGDLMYDAALGAGVAAAVDFWTPIPSAFRRTWQRGFQPTRLLAARLAARSGKPAARLLRLLRVPRPQKDLARTNRAANVSGAFAGPRWRTLSGAKVGLVDDVMTTGATLQEAARALHRAGASRVVGVVLAVVGAEPVVDGTAAAG